MRGERGGDGAAWMMRGMECRGLEGEGADREEERTYWEGRGTGSTRAIMRCDERWEAERETGREVRATMMRSEPCWETGRTIILRGGEGASSSCSTFTVGGPGVSFWVAL
jgi:hypothetical protein